MLCTWELELEFLLSLENLESIVPQIGPLLVHQAEPRPESTLKLGKSATVPLALDPSERRLKLDTGRAFTGNPNAPPRHTIRFMTESRPGRRRGSRPIDQLLLDLTSYALDHCHHVDDDTDRCCKSRIQVVNYLLTYLLTYMPSFFTQLEQSAFTIRVTHLTRN